MVTSLEVVGLGEVIASLEVVGVTEVVTSFEVVEEIKLEYIEVVGATKVVKPAEVLRLDETNELVKMVELV